MWCGIYFQNYYSIPKSTQAVYSSQTLLPRPHVILTQTILCFFTTVKTWSKELRNISDSSVDGSCWENWMTSITKALNLKTEYTATSTASWHNMSTINTLCAKFISINKSRSVICWLQLRLMLIALLPSFVKMRSNNLLESKDVAQIHQVPPPPFNTGWTNLPWRDCNQLRASHGSHVQIYWSCIWSLSQIIVCVCVCVCVCVDRLVATPTAMLCIAGYVLRIHAFTST
jgi:hypothetical protein